MARALIDENKEKRDTNRTRQSHEQSELLGKLEQIKKTLLENYNKVIDKDLLEDAFVIWMKNPDTLAATLDLKRIIDSKPSLKLRKRYFENIGWSKQQDLQESRQKRSKIKPLPERIAGLREVIQKYKV